MGGAGAGRVLFGCRPLLADCTRVSMRWHEPFAAYGASFIRNSTIEYAGNVYLTVAPTCPSGAGGAFDKSSDGFKTPFAVIHVLFNDFAFTTLAVPLAIRTAPSNVIVASIALLVLLIASSVNVELFTRPAYALNCDEAFRLEASVSI